MPQNPFTTVFRKLLPPPPCQYVSRGGRQGIKGRRLRLSVSICRSSLSSTATRNLLKILSFTAAMTSLKTAISWTWLLRTLPLLMLAVLVGGDLRFPGKCPQRQPVDNIQFPRIIGKWYVFAEYLKVGYTVKCHRIEFSSDRYGKFSGFSRRKFFVIDIAQVVSAPFKNFRQNRVTLRSRAQFLPNTTVGTYNATPYINPNGIPPTSYNILHIEYNRTAFISSCFEGLDNRTNQVGNSQYLVVLTKDPIPEEEQKTSIKQTASQLGLWSDLWQEIDQATCGYTPRD